MFYSATQWKQNKVLRTMNTYLLNFDNSYNTCKLSMAKRFAIPMHLHFSFYHLFALHRQDLLLWSMIYLVHRPWDD